MTDWRDQLPALRGRIARDEPLAPFTWLRVGGPAELLFLPADEHDLAAFLAALPDDVPLHILGVGSNTLVRDGGPVELQDSMVPDRLSCSARFRHNFMRIPSPWLVERRTNMPRAGAVATTLRCEPA